MKLINETYVRCEECGVEAFGLYSIDRFFGYTAVGQDINPFTRCKNCRQKKEEFIMYERDTRVKRWATAAGWGKEFNVSSSIFNGYLIELGYLEFDKGACGKHNCLVVTGKGREHSAIINPASGEDILWDYDTCIEIGKVREGEMRMKETSES